MRVRGGSQSRWQEITGWVGASVNVDDVAAL